VLESDGRGGSPKGAQGIPCTGGGARFDILIGNHSATDETRIKHGCGNDHEQERKKIGRKRTHRTHRGGGSVGGTPNGSDRDGRDPRKRRWEKAVRKRGFSCGFPTSSRLFPRFPGISHLFPLNFYFMTKRSKISPQRRGDAEVNAKYCGKNYGFFGFPSPPRDGCPMELFAARNVVAKVRKSSDCFTKLRESSRKFAQIRAVVTRCYALLRVRPIFCGEGQETTFKEAMKPRKQTEIDQGCGRRVFLVARFGARELA